MKKTIIIILSILPWSLGAQQKSRSSFDANAGFYADVYDVVRTMPQNMTDLDTTADITTKRGYRSGSFYKPVLESQNKEYIDVSGLSSLYNGFR